MWIRSSPFDLYGFYPELWRLNSFVVTTVTTAWGGKPVAVRKGEAAAVAKRGLDLESFELFFDTPSHMFQVSDDLLLRNPYGL